MQHAIREFLKLRTSYDVLPVSFRLIVLDTNLLVNRSLNILVQNGTPLASAERAIIRMLMLMCCCNGHRRRVSTTMELENIYFCRTPHLVGLH